MSNTADDAAVARSVRETTAKHRNTPYFRGAEAVMDVQWGGRILKYLKGCDFSCVLDLACGYGRNSAKLRPLSGEIHLVDVNEHCIAACRDRFAGQPGAPLHFHVNDGSSLSMLADNSITLVYSWDAVVHFDAPVIQRYVREFARIMRPGARGFIHHSNYAAIKPDGGDNWLENPHWRSKFSGAMFREFCEQCGLHIERQDTFAWGNVPNLDCISVFSKPA